MGVHHSGEESAVSLVTDERAGLLCTNCAVCGEICESKSITIALPRAASGLAVFRNVPAEVCPHCGETRFSLHTTGRLMAVVRESMAPDEVVMVPIYDLESAGKRSV